MEFLDGFARDIQKSFFKEYAQNEKFRGYIEYVGISLIGMWDTDVRGTLKDSYCLVVKLKQPLPDNLKLPSLYKGMRIYIT